MQKNEHAYGVGSNSYQAAGELAGITRLVDTFYENMEQLPEARTIRAMHQADLTETSRRLTHFLCGWLGGPRLYSEHYGPINIPDFHKHFKIGNDERDAWLCCMQKAISVQPYHATFKEYLLAQLGIPAERIRQAGAAVSIS